MLDCKNRAWCPFSENGCHERRPLCRNYRPLYADEPPEPRRDWAQIRATLDGLRARRTVIGVVQRRCRGCGKWFRDEDMQVLRAHPNLGRRWCPECARAATAKLQAQKKNRKQEPPKDNETLC